MSELQTTINEIRTELGKTVKLIAVSKTYPRSAVEAARACGVMDFGENKVQELKSKAMPEDDFNWHLIGHLQTNKTKDAVRYASRIHSVDSLRLLKLIDKEAEKINKTIPCLLQLNLAQEETKSGMSISELEDMLEEAMSLSYAKVDGFMVIGPLSEDKDKIEAIFAQAEQLLKHYQKQYPALKELSMGMSSDYPIAIKHSSTMVRVGSKIFGQRDYSKK